MKARIPTNVNWTAESLTQALEKLDPNTELVFGNPAQVAKGTQGTNKCWCGCGTTTKSRFAPGHDARFHGEAKRAAKGMIPVRTDFIHDEARADWMKWYEKTKAEIAAKAIPAITTDVAEISEIADIEDIAEVDGIPAMELADQTDELTDSELFDQFDNIG